MDQLSPERLVYLSALFTLSLCGFGVISITSYCKVSKGSVQLALTRALWKFESEENKKTIYNEKCWSWRKLVLAGLMIASLTSTIVIKLCPPKLTLTIAAGIFLVWLIGILAYWYISVAPAFSKDKRSRASVKEGSPEAAKTTDGANPALEAWLTRKLDKDGLTDSRLPLTIVTGFLGSGKTTLVKNILQNTVGMRVLVIENEIGAEGIDHELLMQHTAKEEIILMNNGCVCCTVRKDLLTTFHRMFSHEAFAQLDWVVIETTGMADPAPLIQSLYMDAECQARLRLDSVLTVVDCKHLPLHLRTPPARKTDSTAEESGAGSAQEGVPAGLKGLFKISPVTPEDKSATIPEAVLQISFADRVLMNKTDLITPTELEALSRTVQQINPTAQLIACQNSQVPIEELLNIRAFDPLQNKALLSTPPGTENAASSAPSMIQVDADGKILKKTIKIGPAAAKSKRDRRMQMSEEGAKIRSKHTVNTVSLVCEKPLDLDLFNAWISQLLNEKGADIYRMKGILWMDGYDEQFVAHGVHMIFDGQRGRPWDAAVTIDASAEDSAGAEAKSSAGSRTAAAVGSQEGQARARRYSRLVFIGIGVERESLEAGFLACCAPDKV